MKWMWQSGIARSILGGFIVFALTVSAFGLFVNVRSLATARTETAASYQNSIAVLARQMEDRTSVMTQVVDYLFTNTNVLYLNYREEADVDQLFGYAELIDNLKFYATASLLKGEIVLYLKNKGKRFSTESGYGNIGGADRATALEVGADLSNHWRLDGEGLIFIRNPLPGRDNHGIVALARIDKSETARFLNGLEAPDPAATPFLLDTHGNVLFAGAGEGGMLDEMRLYQAVSERGAEADQFVMDGGNGRNRVIYGKSESSGLTVGMIFPETYAQRSVAAAYRLTIASATLALLLGGLFAWMMYSKLLKPLRQLVEGMHQFGKGQFATRLDYRSNKEFGFIFRQFNRMASDTERLVNEVYVERLNAQTTQLKLLQSRINPHFLYNCLNFIYQMSMGEDHEGAARMSSYLGKYFRYMAKSDKETITLREELDNITALLEIQRLRFEDRIRYEFHVPEELLEREIPSLVVQPIVENAIVHGMPADRGGLLIRISARDTAQGLEVEVDDNGRGISEARLEELRRQLDVYETGGGSIGLNNTHWRLKLKYGEHAGLRLRAPAGGGLAVAMTAGPLPGGAAEPSDAAEPASPLNGGRMPESH